MVLIGVAGSIGHGKSTLSEFLQDQDPGVRAFEFSDLVGEVSSKLNHFFSPPINPNNLETVNAWLSHVPAILEEHTTVKAPVELFVLTQQKISDSPGEFAKLWDYIKTVNTNPKLLEQPISQTNKAQYRALLQWLGGYCAQNLPEDVWAGELVRRAQATANCPLAIIGGIRFQKDVDAIHAAGGSIIRVKRPIAAADPNDPTERESSKLHADCTVENDGDLPELKAKARALYRDLLANQLLRTY